MKVISFNTKCFSDMKDEFIYIPEKQTLLTFYGNNPSISCLINEMPLTELLKNDGRYDGWLLEDIKKADYDPTKIEDLIKNVELNDKLLYEIDVSTNKFQGYPGNLFNIAEDYSDGDEELLNEYETQYNKLVSMVKQKIEVYKKIEPEIKALKQELQKDL